jgi:DNA replication protein DnaC
VTPDEIQPDLKTVMRRLRLGKLLDTLPERLALARQQKMPHQDFLLLLLGDEVSRRDGAAVVQRVQRADLDPQMRLENWDPSAKVHFDQALLNELASLRFVEAGRHATIVGPVGVGKTFLAHALGHAACRRGYTVLAIRTDKMLKGLKHARLDHSYEAELRKLLAVDLLLVDDFGLDAMDHQESRDAYEIFLERDRAGSIIVTSNRGPDEWIATFADPVRAQAAIDRFTSNAYDLVIEGESYRSRLKPTLKTATPAGGTGQNSRKSGKRKSRR